MKKTCIVAVSCILFTATARSATAQTNSRSAYRAAIEHVGNLPEPPAGNAVKHFFPGIAGNTSTKRERVGLGRPLGTHSLALRACICGVKMLHSVARWGLGCV
jgi:hypothetical protein